VSVCCDNPENWQLFDSQLMDFLEWFLSEAIWHIMFPFWAAVRGIIAQEWYLDLADWVGRVFPGMNW